MDKVKDRGARLARKLMQRVLGSDMDLGHSPENPVPKEVYPASDPTNQGGWVLLESMSDEFSDLTSFDETKWIQGTGRNWLGRIPVYHNDPEMIELAENELKLRVQVKTPEGQDKFRYCSGYITSRESRRYGYFEVRMCPCDAPLSNTFWLFGGSATFSREIDIFETASAIPSFKNRMGTNMHEWKTPTEEGLHDEHKARPGKKIELDFQPMDDFHTYGCEWDHEYTRFFADGKLVREEKTDGFDIGMQLKCGVEYNEHFQKDLDDSMFPAVYRVKYIRTWIKPPTQRTIFVHRETGVGQREEGVGLSWEKPYRLIQHAIDNANDGDTILVGPGIYPQNVSLVGVRGVKLIGGVNVGDMDGSCQDIELNRCIIKSPKGHGPALALDSAVDCVVDGFTVEGVTASWTGGVRISGPYTGTKLMRCKITGNSPNQGGGAGVNVGSSTFGEHCEFVSCTFTGNAASGKFGGGGGVSLYEGGDNPRNPKARFIDCIFEFNKGAKGSALAFHANGEGVCHLERCIFRSNSGDEAGDAMTVLITGGRCEVVDSIFVNSPGTDIVVRSKGEVSQVEVTGCVFSNAGHSNIDSDWDQCVIQKSLFHQPLQTSSGVMTKIKGKAAKCKADFDSVLSIRDCEVGDPCFENVHEGKIGLTSKSPAFLEHLQR
mmetsp:Transcript_15347/g.31131  ORF Transcript_15347/g.31131 Transcript_15347/m.31131 type:complete len:660 (-) Transcript_15347:3159-5138(-)|eukprot:CAMPEP_0184686590 /NCGR_PEP_ID=MMETSP0312-20130426/23114_1 /TAXON_ID=31354 /ORGANISM="Compsopogon coeruleus, Strain SAG 36.94" /LENGTH=659 /DNA_ID=CAMNT_0027141833 /DNA_START=45 /DNA_END=2024 /DNA_ORIENTATION=-